MADIKTIAAVEARTHLGEIMKRAFKKGEHFIVEKSGIPMIAILAADEYIRLFHERKERFKILDSIKSRIPDIPSEETEKDISEAIQAIRKKSA